MRKLYYLNQAKDDLVHIKQYIARECGSQKVALEYTNKIRQQCCKLAGLPGEMGRLRPELREDLHSFSYGNYVIFFRYVGNNLEVVTIIEGHRDIEALFKER